MKKRVDYQLNNRREQLEQRRHLRSNGTPAEAAMWKLLKNKKISIMINMEILVKEIHKKVI